MSYFVTGATGFIGRYLVERLLDRKGQVYVLVRRQSRDKFTALKASLGTRGRRVVAVYGDLAEPQLGVSATDRTRL